MRDYLQNLQEMAQEVEPETEYNGYWYKISDVVTILCVGLVCNLRNAHEIWQWSQAKPTREMFRIYFKISKMPCYAQFMNILGNVNAESLNRSFMKWCKMLIEDEIVGKTIAIDGKTICSTVNMQGLRGSLAM